MRSRSPGRGSCCDWPDVGSADIRTRLTVAVDGSFGAAVSTLRRLCHSFSVRKRVPPPDPTLHKVGKEDGGRRGVKQLDLLRMFGLNRDSHVLEIGCGVGRLAYELSDQLGPSGAYVGFDISKTAIDWLNEHYAPRLPNFSFDLADVLNPR